MEEKWLLSKCPWCPPDLGSPLAGAWKSDGLDEMRIQGPPFAQEPESPWLQQGLQRVSICNPLHAASSHLYESSAPQNGKTKGNECRTEILPKITQRDHPRPPRDWPGACQGQASSAAAVMSPIPSESVFSLAHQALAARDLDIYLRSLGIDQVKCYKGFLS